MSHVIVASVAMVSISHNSRGAADARPGPGSYFAARGGYVRTEGLGDLPLAQYGACTTITQAFSATLLRHGRQWQSDKEGAATVLLAADADGSTVLLDDVSGAGEAQT